MIERVNEKNIAEYEEFIKSHPAGLVYQSSKWAKVKSEWKWEAVMLKNDDGSIRAAGAVLIRSIPYINRSLLYCCRGFTADESDFEAFDELLSALLKIGREYKAFAFKIDPEVFEDNDAYRKHLKEKGFTELNPGCLNFENVQPRCNYCFDYNGLGEDELMLTFKSDYRNRIRKAYRKGVEIKICGKEALPEFVELMKETGERDGFLTRPVAYFEKILDSLGEDARLYMAYYEGKAIAGTIAIRWGRVMKYQYGASSNSHRNVYPNYALQWEMIKWGLESGCEVYDFGGISGEIDNPDNPNYGLWRFKHGFGGYVANYVGEFDLVLNKPVYKLYNIASRIRER